MADINFQPVFDYIDQSILPLKEDILTVKNDMREVKTAVANLSTEAKNYNEELLVSGHRLDRLEGWGKKVGSKVGIPLKF